MGSKSIGYALSEVFNSPLPARYIQHSRPFGETFVCGPASVKLRQVAYDGGLWYLTGWMDLRDANGRWYVSMRLEAADKVIYVEEDTLHFQQTLLPSLPWVELVPAPPKQERAMGVIAASGMARRAAR